MESSQKRILVVDDSAETREIITSGLERRGYRVFSFSGGREALEKIGGEKYDLLIVDIVMPDMDGITLVQELRKKDGFTLPVLFISAKDRLENYVRYIDDSSRFLSKPFRLNDLEAKIRLILS